MQETYLCHKAKDLENHTIQQLKRLIEDADSFCITAHKSPDGDAVGSSLALAWYLKAIGKQATVVLPDGFADFLSFLPGAEEIITYEEHRELAEEVLNKSDLIFCLDYNHLNRTGAMQDVLAKEVGQKPFVLIDHHQNPADFPDVLISDTTSCSTAQLIYRVIDRMGDRDKIDQNAAKGMYCGIMTDSGSFRFPAVTPETHEIAADLIRKGADHAAIHRAVYDTNLLDRLRLVGYALSEKLVVMPEYHTAYISLSADELERFNYRPGDTEGLVNQALSIKGVNFAAFIREGNNQIKMSLRSQGQFRVNEIAAQYFNGGGHHNAAGGAVDAKLDDVIDTFREVVQKHRHDLNYEV